MKIEEYDRIQSHVRSVARVVEEDKRPAYTMGSDDVLANFKRVGKAAGIAPSQVALVYCLKHIDSISAYIKNRDAISQSEPMIGRFCDAKNYLDLIVACLVEERDAEFLTIGDAKE